MRKTQKGRVLKLLLKKFRRYRFRSVLKGNEAGKGKPPNFLKIMNRVLVKRFNTCGKDWEHKDF